MSTPELTRLSRDYPPALRPAFTLFDRVSRWLSIGGMAFFLVMVFLTFADVFLRYVFNVPLRGTVEVTEFMMVFGVFAGMAYCQVNRNMVGMDIITGRLSEQNFYLLETVTGIMSAAIMVMCTYATYRYSLSCKIVTGIFGMPHRWYILWAAFGMALLTLALFKQVIVNIYQASRWSHWVTVLLAVLVGLAIVALGAHIVTHRLIGWSPESIGGIALLVLLFMFFMGVPVPYALLISGYVFACAIRGPVAGLSMFGKAWVTTVASYNYSPLVFFMLLGYFCFYGGFGQDIYQCARERIGHLRGGLAMGTVIACAMFGAVVGDVLPGSIAMAAIALPEMRKHHYDDGLAVGTLACSGTLGCLIPPSGSFIIYGILAEQSIGELFIAGIVPGIVCMLCFMTAIWLVVWRRPELAPRLPKPDKSQRSSALKSVLPVGLIFIVVIGGIYGGFFTPTEGGAVGSTCMFILALALRRLSWQRLFNSLSDTAKYTAMTFAVLGAASALGTLMTLSRIPLFVGDFVAGLQVAPMVIMLVIILVLCFLGCFIPATPLMLICIPLFVPIAHMFNWDLVWFGVIITIVFNLAAITPPFGISLFVMKAIADVPLTLMFRAALPFVIATFLCLGLIVAFPALSLTLPHLMR